jgi:hypothetical protein
MTPAFANTDSIAGLISATALKFTFLPEMLCRRLLER